MALPTRSLDHVHDHLAGQPEGLPRMRGEMTYFILRAIAEILQSMAILMSAVVLLLHLRSHR